MRWFAVLLLLGGLALMIIGIGGAVRELGETYSHVLNDPLEARPEDEGDALAGRMLVFVGIGVVGVVPAAVGGAMLKIGLIRRLRGRSKTVGR